MFRYFVFCLLLTITSLPSISSLRCLQCASFGFVSKHLARFDGLYLNQGAHLRLVMREQLKPLSAPRGTYVSPTIWGCQTFNIDMFQLTLFNVPTDNHFYGFIREAVLSILKFISANAIVKIHISQLEGLQMQWIRPDQWKASVLNISLSFSLAKTLTRDCIPSDK